MEAGSKWTELRKVATSVEDEDVSDREEENCFTLP